jgi:pyridinium-3,5-bisthiocarboxylic acid mononucleotide nickel chelatase
VTETLLYFDCFAGICGNMVLGAMVDLGVPEDHLRSELAKLGLSGYTLAFSRGERKGISGTRADVELSLAPLAVGKAGGGAPGFGPARQGQGRRPFKEIKALVEGCALPEPTKARTLGIYAKLAEAEAAVHGTSVDEVHFHEVGAVDSIVDIAGAAICLEYLKPDRVLASRVELGGGFVRCHHGLLPVPVPAVAKLLEGRPVRGGAFDMEMTTPTGAAILVATADEFTDDKRFVIERTAYGVGHRDTEIPDLLRLFLGRSERAAPA